MEECPDLDALRGYLTNGYAFNDADADEIVATMKEAAKLKLQNDELRGLIAEVRDVMAGNGDKKDPAYRVWYEKTRDAEKRKDETRG
jgi:hypothetical protein